MLCEKNEIKRPLINKASCSVARYEPGEKIVIVLCHPVHHPISENPYFMAGLFNDSKGFFIQHNIFMMRLQKTYYDPPGL